MYGQKTGKFASGTGKGGRKKKIMEESCLGWPFNEENEFGEFPKLKKGYNFEAHLVST